ncbi:malto-oligosyltrehalose trehalohydrolase [Caulobacter sp. S45]|uniref:malto-oligosyltrehalose trehalohydrolase n=1 Tax=Caulobacter sp. S45 TaxID=1641861 RepID=UPI001C2CE653|nr:malto-oligosyltrehalose trehalohydrolase [Caulobacter sp. S45]
MSRFAADLGFGATLLGEGRAGFRVWAPSMDQAELEIEGRGRLPMARSGEGWFEAETDCQAGACYRYVFGDLAAPDPASRAQADDVHGFSVVVDPHAYEWRTGDWQGRPWCETVLYEVHAGLLGGFSGVAERLPALKALGVTAVELMPIADFPGRRNWGYDGVLPYAPDAAYGSPDELKALVDRAHELGLMIFLDVVYNHFGPDGAYVHAYAPQMFRKDLHTPWGGAIDFRRPQVRDYFTRNAIYWINEYRFDGLRFDAVHAISEQDWLTEMAQAVRAAAGPVRHVHLVLENEHNAASHLRGPFDAQWNDDFHNVMHVLLTGETGAYYQDFADRPAERLARCLSQGFIYQGEPSPNHDGEPRGEPSDDLPPTAFVSFLQNHDQAGNRAMGERLIDLADPQALRAATALMLLCPQIPLLFMGEETGSRTPFLFFTDFHDELADAVREGRRKEFAKFPEFSDPERRKRIPDPNASATFECSRPRPGEDADTWRRFYADLLELRRTHVVPGLDGARSIGAEVLGEKAVLARWSLAEGAVLTLAINLADVAVPLSGHPAGAPVYGAGSLAVDRLDAHALVAWLEAKP